MAAPAHDVDVKQNDEFDEIKTDRIYDITIYGATGFTGAIASGVFLERYLRTDMDLKWCIAGRSVTKLQTLRSQLQSEAQSLEVEDNASVQRKLSYVQQLPMVIADVANETALRRMIASTKLVICCIGPYRLYGEKVIEYCAHYGTHYVDICGEPDFIERSAFKYYHTAQTSGAIIVSACGFDSIPSDIGVAFVDNLFASRGALCSTINGYLSGSAPDGYPVHHTTLQAAVYGMSEAQKLRSLRKQIESSSNNDNDRYRMPRAQIERTGAKQRIHKESYFWSDEAQKYCMLFPGADSAVVANSQGVTAALLHAQQQLQPPKTSYPQYAAYIAFNSHWSVLQTVALGGLGQFLVQYEFGRNLYLKYPSWMTWGAFSEQGPSETQRASQEFTFRFFARGYSKRVRDEYGDGDGDDGDAEKLKVKPDMNVVAKVTGADIAYTGTCKMLVQCALVLLTEEQQIKAGDVNKGCPSIKGGVFTPATVFGIVNTSLVRRLNEVGITFTVERVDGDDANAEQKENDDEDGNSNEYEMVNNPPKQDANEEAAVADDVDVPK
mmetsp:Transcript_56517/g.94090  ORF Transcript_56517/g.94090 Transcript_56517/m.94090 type:complete len:552 (-) Transcript_56517:102-1757(-)